jgi:hypothetical protein
MIDDQVRAGGIRKTVCVRMSRAPGNINAAFAALMVHVMIDDATDSGIKDGILVVTRAPI